MRMIIGHENLSLRCLLRAGSSSAHMPQGGQALTPSRAAA
eukprot:CAMPEP_0197666336 /NCGR_PEP_ID=MMETSP1338-20131121/62181_1 /TAXON_ID=43686 ORGANISM="Pelagodinium beii, Strain RCC1491" /NCGR_SAMPLE_ID=MMETSP1338 /ASSEMBLY_ACC=CAM_ASM_000754 /LENGTH=39 /DNA_ID= /DNA_START= /DNA_END= /DNA_ORIENTATION=